LPPDSLRSLRDWLRVEATYTSNAIEGNSLSRQETTVVLEGMTIGGKSLRDHLEALDHAEAFDYMYDLASRDTPFTEADLRSLHRLVLQRSQPQYAGRYREIQVWISGSSHVPPAPVEVPALMADRFTDLRAMGGEHPVRRAALFHARLVSIHPFADGNGRTARLASNLLLLRDRYPLAIIQPTPEARALYFKSLQGGASAGGSSNGGERDPIVSIFGEACERTADFMLQSLAPRKKTSRPSKPKQIDSGRDL
jgi:Fic family protein